MIDFVIFQQRMMVLSDWYGKAMNEAHLAMYYRAIKDRLTTEQFEVACDRVFVEERFFPVPVVLMEKVLGVSDPALLAWTRILATIADPEMEVELDQAATFALRSIGGVYGIKNSALKDRQWLKREFCEYYAMAPQVGSLPQAITLNQKVLPASTVEAVPLDPEKATLVRRILAESAEAMKFSRGA